MDDFPKPLMIVLRILIGYCGLFIALRYLTQIPSGAVEWASGEGEGTDLSYMYRATTPGALLAAALGLGGFSLGFLVFAISPKTALRPEYILPWIVICMSSLIMLKRLSTFVGIFQY